MPMLENIYYPSKFNSVYIKTHHDYEDDLKNILEKSGSRADFSGKYKQRLKYLDEKKEDCILRRSWFEKLKWVEDLYSMKFNRSQKNIRILFTFVNFKGEKYVVLLHAFEEKDNNKQSKYSYDRSIPIALKRFKEVVSNG